MYNVMLWIRTVFFFGCWNIFICICISEMFSTRRGETQSRVWPHCIASVIIITIHLFIVKIKNGWLFYLMRQNSRNARFINASFYLCWLLFSSVCCCQVPYLNITNVLLFPWSRYWIQHNDSKDSKTIFEKPGAAYDGAPLFWFIRN